MRPCIFIVGTRAQLVKVAPVLRLAAASELPHTFWLAGQHEDSIDDLIEDFQLEAPLRPAAQHQERSSITGLLTWLPGAVRDCRRHILDTAAAFGKRPLVVVHGDTLSTLLGATAARMSRADVVHMESGLTSGRLLDPFPEELIRRLVFRLSRFALCPGAETAERMRRRGGCEVVDTGENTLLDCVRFALDANRQETEAASDAYVVASIHRFENIYHRQRLDGIVRDIVQLSARVPVHFVLHPPTEKRLRHFRLWETLSAAEHVRLRPRMPYTRFLALLAGSRGVLTDGGSNQEELSYLGVPTVLFRERSERPDGIGANVLFRSQVDGDLDRYVANNGLEALRQPHRLDDRLQPSSRVMDALMRWSSGKQHG